MFNTPVSVVHPVQDLATSKAWYSKLLGMEPTDDHAFYVGFNLGDFEIGLDPHGFDEGLTGPVLYFRVDDIDASYKELLAKGARERQPPADMGSVILATVFDIDDHIIGLLQNN